MTVTKASKFNRVLLILVVIITTLNYLNVRALSISTVEMNSNFAKQKVAVEANTKQLVDFMAEWVNTQQELSDWMQKQKEVQDYIARKNPKLKIPVSPPVPDALPRPQGGRYTPEPRPTPIVIEKTKKIYIKPRPTPSAFERLFLPHSTR